MSELRTVGAVPANPARPRWSGLAGADEEFRTMFVATYPELDRMNVMNLSSPQSAILSAVIFNAVIIVLLVPLSLRGVRYRPAGAAALLRRNLLIYGVGGIVVPFIGIKAIDVLITALGLA